MYRYCTAYWLHPSYSGSCATLHLLLLWERFRSPAFGLALNYSFAHHDFNSSILVRPVNTFSPNNFKCKGLPRHDEGAQGVKAQDFLNVSARVVGRQPKAPAAFTPGEIPGTHFQRLSRPQGTWKKSPVTPTGIDPGTVRLVAQRLNHYATPGPPTTLTFQNLTFPHQAYFCNF